MSTQYEIIRKIPCLQTCTVAEFAAWLQINGLHLRATTGAFGHQHEPHLTTMVELVSADCRTAWKGIGSNWLEAVQKAIDFWASPAEGEK